MTQLRTTVLMKADIAGSTPKFRALLATDLQTLLVEHQAFVARHASDHGGKIVKPAGDGYWLEFPSVTAAAKSAIAMQETFSLVQKSRGDDRLSMRVVIGLGDVAIHEGDLVGEVLALVTRIEAITPADEIYLTSAARLALKAADIQTALIDSFALKGFAEPVAVYRVDQRHRTRTITEEYILYLDLRGFTRLAEALPVAKGERILDTLYDLTNGAAHEFGGTVRYSLGDDYCLTFREAVHGIAAAEWLSEHSAAEGREQRFGCAINMALHRGTIHAYRHFFYGEGLMIAARVLAGALDLLAANEGGVFVTSTLRDCLSGSPWHNRLQPVALKSRDARIAGIEIYRLGEA
jgi:class 3 adenylate cyclase